MNQSKFILGLHKQKNKFQRTRNKITTKHLNKNQSLKKETKNNLTRQSYKKKQNYNFEIMLKDWCTG